MTKKGQEKALRQFINLRFPSIQDLSATGASMTVRVSSILKVCSDDSELRLLTRLNDCLGNKYAKVLPRFQIMGAQDEWQVIELEDLGDQTLEDVALDGSTDSTLMNTIIDCVGELIRCIASVRPEKASTEACTQSFLDEVTSATVCNARNAQLASPERNLDRLARHCKLVPTLCHRDLSTSNVICRNGSAKLIDPRWAVPGASTQPHSPFGSIAIDCAAFSISLWRKSLERKQTYSEDAAWNYYLDQTVTHPLMQSGLFNQKFYDLCLMHALSVYIACRCDYCLAPERLWLYEHMQQCYDETSRRITNT